MAEEPHEISLNSTDQEEKKEMLLPEEKNIIDSRDKMKKNITVLRGISLVVGTMIGTGIFITPNSITRRVNAPATSIMVWLGGGVLAAVGGLVFSELGTMIPVSGSNVAYIKRIYGPVPSFIALWFLWFLLSGMIRSINVLAFVKYFWAIFYDDPDTEVNWWATKAVALSVFFIIVAVVTIKPTVILQSIVFFTFAKLAACVIIIIAGFVSLAKGNTENIKLGFEDTNTDIRGWSEAFNAIVFSYAGWSQVCTVASEMKNPQREIPIVVCSSIALVTLIYVLTVTSFHIVVPLSVMTQNTAVASEFGLRTMGEAGKIVLAVGVVFSTLGNVQCSFLSATRMIHAGAAEGLLPSCFGLVSKRFKTPVVAILYIAAVASVFIVVGNINMLISTSSFAWFPFIIASSVGVIVMRVTHPDIPRPYRVPLILPVVFALAESFVFILPFLGEGWLMSLIWVFVALSGVPVYYLFSKNVFEWKILTWCNEKMERIISETLDCD